MKKVISLALAFFLVFSSAVLVFADNPDFFIQFVSEFNGVTTTYTIQYDFEKDSIAGYTENYLTDFPPSDPDNKFEVVGWVDDSGISYSIDDLSAICKNLTIATPGESVYHLTLNAVWERVNYPELYIAFDSPDNSEKYAIAYNYKDKQISATSTNYADISHIIFMGWIIDGELFSIDNLETIYEKHKGDMDLDLSYYNLPLPAVWGVEYTFNNGTSTEIIIFTIGENNSTLLPNPTREGYKFLGWFDSAGNLYTGGMVTADPSAITALEARWEKLPEDDPGATGTPGAAGGSGLVGTTGGYGGSSSSGSSASGSGSVAISSGSGENSGSEVQGSFVDENPYTGYQDNLNILLIFTTISLAAAGVAILRKSIRV